MWSPKQKPFPFLLLFSIFFFLGPHPSHMEVPRLGVERELQLPAYTTATVTRDPSHVCNLHHSLRQHRILNPLSEARDRTRSSRRLCRVLDLLSHDENSSKTISMTATPATQYSHLATGSGTTMYYLLGSKQICSLLSGTVKLLNCFCWRPVPPAPHFSPKSPSHP